MHRDQDIRLFIFFSLYPFGGIFTHQKMKKIRQNQKFPIIYTHTQLNMRVPKKFQEILFLWHALLTISQPLHVSWALQVVKKIILAEFSALMSVNSFCKIRIGQHISCHLEWHNNVPLFLLWQPFCNLVAFHNWISIKYK